ncbi:hypothetical protein [uncultured Mesonia sp.]|uniref:hypothetical protein n=1 Tax=uncultured Mesonia sp. TaxID=399731 RepID=UPI00374FBE6B
MKNVFFALAFMLVGTFAFANTEVTSENDLLFSRCCEITLVDIATCDSVTVTACRTTITEACDAAYTKAKAAVSTIGD